VVLAAAVLPVKEVMAVPVPTCREVYLVVLVAAVLAVVHLER